MDSQPQEESERDSSPAHSSSAEETVLQGVKQVPQSSSPSSPKESIADSPVYDTLVSSNLQADDDIQVASLSHSPVQDLGAERLTFDSSNVPPSAQADGSPNVPADSQIPLLVEVEDTLDTLVSPGHDIEMSEGLISPQSPIEEESSFEESVESQDSTAKYLGDNSSSYPKELIDVGKRKNLKKKRESKVYCDESSVKTASPSAPRRTIFQSENACQTDGIVEKLERLELPGLVAVQQHVGVPDAGRVGCLVQGKHHVQQTTLCSAITAKFHGPAGAVFVPLDNLSARSTDAGTHHSITRRGVTVDLHTNHHTTNPKHTPQSRHNVDAHVTYRAPSQITGHGPQWKVDIDGAGLQVIVNMADENAKKRKAKSKIRRSLLSYWPPKIKPNISRATKKRLEWIEDEAEEKHVQRIVRARCGVVVTKPEVTSEVKLPHHSHTSLENSSIQNHLERMTRAEYIKQNNIRLMPERPSFIPPATLVPSSSNFGVYEDEHSKRIREAREFYNDLSTNLKVKSIKN